MENNVLPEGAKFQIEDKWYEVKDGKVVEVVEAQKEVAASSDNPAPGTEEKPEEQALADGAFGLALGLPLHLALPPFITGGPLVTQVLTEGLKDITGGSVIVDPDPESAANTLESEILDRRKGLGLK